MSLLQRIRNWFARTFDANDPEEQVYENLLAPHPYPEPGSQVLADTIHSPVSKRKGRPRRNEARNAEIANYLCRGESYREVADKMGVSTSTVAGVAQAYGIMRQRGRRPGLAQTAIGLALERRDQNIVNAYEEGKTLQQVGDAYDLTRERVRQILKAAGVKSRPRGTRGK